MAQRISRKWRHWAVQQWVSWNSDTSDPNPPLPFGEPGSISGVCELTVGATIYIPPSGVNSENLSNLTVRFQSDFITVLNREIVPELAYGVLAGSSDLLIASTSAIGAIVAISGSVNIAFTESAEIDGIGILYGAAEQIFQGTGYLSAIVPISGSSDLLFTAIISQVINIAGSAGLVFGSNTFFQTLNPIIGVAPAVFQQSVTPILGATKPISGSAAIVLSFGNPTLGSTGGGGVGEMFNSFIHSFRGTWFDVVPPKLLDTYYRNGTVDLTLGGTGELTGTGNLTAFTQILFHIIPVFPNGYAPISGSAAMSFSADVGQMVGTATLTFGATAYTSLVGQCNLTLGGSATLVGTGNLQASLPITILPQALLTTFGMFGQANISFSAALGQIFRGVGAKLVSGFDTRYPYVSTDFLQPQNLFTTALIATPVDITISPVATLTATGALAGTVDLVFGSDVSIEGAAAGSTDITFSLYATPRADGALAGTVDLIFSEVAVLGVSIPVVGETTVTFSLIGRLHRKGVWTPEVPKDDNWTPVAPKTNTWTPEAPKTNSWIKKTGT